MNKTIRFYKEPTERWYADVPEWTGPKEDLEMVAGADLMLEILAEEEREITIQFYTSLDEIKDETAHVLTLFEKCIDDGAEYIWEEYNLGVWLCDVTKFVFETFPKVIYFNVK